MSSRPDLKNARRRHNLRRTKESTAFFAAATAVTGLFSGFAYASPVITEIAAPAGLNPGDKFRVVFVTDGEGTGDSADISTYDTFVQNEAASANLQYNGVTPTWQALVSTADNPATDANDPVNAVDRFNPTTPIFRIDGVQVASSGSDLWDGTIDNPIDISPTNATITNIVWTGTGTDGTGATSMSGSKALGNTNSFDVGPPIGPLTTDESGSTTSSDSAWISSGTNFDSESAHYYAVSSELTFVPEPAAMGILALAGAVFRRPRK
jgi:hypothetical protein